MSAFLLAACVVTADQSVEGNPNDPRGRISSTRSARWICCRARPADVGNTGIGSRNSSRPAIYLGDGTTSSGAARIEREEGGSGGGFDLSFENAPVATVAKVILVDLLGVGDTIDPRVQGTVTLASVRPIAKADALTCLKTRCG